MVGQNSIVILDEALSNIANNHNVTGRQVQSKFCIQMGLQDLSGGHSEEHVRENAYIDFKLTPSEMKQLISASKEPEAYLSIYEQLENKTLMKLQDVILSYSQVKEAELPVLLDKIGHYIAKLDPTSLSQIIVDQDAFIVDTLKEYGANFSEITSYAYVRIINAHGIEFIDVLKEKLQIPPEKLLVASLSSNYFAELFDSSDLKKLSKNDVLKIIKTYPNKIEAFIKADIAPEILLLSFAILGKKQKFNDLVNYCDLNKLTNLDLIKIINNFGSQIVNLLYEKGVNFSILTSNDLNILVQSHGIEMARALAGAGSSAGLLVPAMKLGGVEAFDELITKVKISEFTNHRLIKEIVKFHPENLSKLIKNGICIESLIMATKSIDNIAQKIFNIFVTNESMDFNDYNEFFFYEIDLLLKTSEGFILLKDLLKKVDLSKLSSSEIAVVVNRVLDNGQVEYLEILADKMDLTNLYASHAMELLTKVIYINEIKYFKILADKMDLTKLLDFYKEELLIKIIDSNEIKYLEILAGKMDLIKLNTSYKEEIIDYAIENNQITFACIIKANYLGYDISTEKCTSIISEILTKSEIDAKEATLSDLLTCFDNVECFNQCLIKDFPSYAECYGKVIDVASEL